MAPSAPIPRRPMHERTPARLLGAAMIVGLAAAVALAARSRLSQGDVALVLLLGVMAGGAGFGLLPALLAAATSALVYDYLFLAPRFTFGIERPGDVLTFAMFFAAASATGWLGGRARDGERRASEREGETLRLLAATRLLASTALAGDTADTLAQQARAAAGRDTAVLLGPADALQIAAADPPLAELEPLSRLAARWTLERREPSGAGTQVNNEAEWSLYPLLGSGGAEGVLALRGGLGQGERLIQGIAVSGGLALERARLANAASENEALRRTDRLRSALLNSLSHDLRTPLAGILGSATTLIDYGATLAESVRADLLQGLREEAERLDSYIGDLLDLSRLEAGALAPRLECADLRDIVAAAVSRVVQGAIRPDVPVEAALARVDAVLLEQALLNVIENAVVHGAPEGASACIRLRLARDGDAWRIEVEDDGPGLTLALQEAVFTPFVRGDVRDPNRPGSGLGLFIARGFTEAMAGSLRVESPLERGLGARFIFRFLAERGP